MNNKISTNVNVEFLIGVNESVSEIINDFLDELQKEARINIDQLNIQFKISKRYFVQEN
ncbi:hypothetical protein [Lysinibacillus sp. KU-BSD001]|uniref:hypothetical protein n=1 Tax=Lysinibacillus sp. KU-BSD001 TaxID=3141328 RepID=UPI0036F20E4A